MNEACAIKIAISAMGGQGGGVLSGWIVKLGERAGYLAQSTSVPGVAQRTGATVYYVELFPESAVTEKSKLPVLALMPAPGDVDIVIAAEFMEAGRAIMRGFVSKRTTLIASSHRDYAIAEKIGMGDGRQGVDGVREAAQKAAGRFIEADMAAAATDAGAVISAVLFGALAGSGALPISRDVFEETIKAGGRAVESNLRGFAKGFEAASSPIHVDTSQMAIDRRAGVPAPAVAPVFDRMRRELPLETHKTAREGLKRCVDYQDIAYADEYLDRLLEIATIDKTVGAGENYRLTNLAAKHLALWMAYEDSIRVADLKTRAERFERFRQDVKADDKQIVVVHEYMHPRVEEICDILPAGLARGILKGKMRRAILKGLLGEGRKVPTTKLRGFLLLWALSKLRFMRRGSYRFSLEQMRIGEWIERIKQSARTSYGFACEIAMLQRLLKGYGDTHERGLASYNRIMSEIDEIARRPNPASTVSGLREAALQDEQGEALSLALTQLQPEVRAAE